jgi:hypothetical protein
MKYLVFDIECCDGKHICEFGYVISDENFKVLKKEYFIINPDKPFNLKGRPDQDDLELCFPEETYYAGKLFPAYYEKIKELLTAKDRIIIGHAVSNDAAFLRTACQRYKLAPLNFSFFDSQRAYSEFSNYKGQISLENVQIKFNLEKPKFLHKSDDDAILTLQLIQSLCEQLSITLPELQTLCPTSCGTSNYFNIQYTGSSLGEMLESLQNNMDSLSNNKKDKCFRSFAEKVENNCAIIQSDLNGKSICFSRQFEKGQLKDALVLLQLLANHRCRYNSKVSECNYYLATEDELTSSEVDEHSRYYAATQTEDGRNVTIVSFEQLCELLRTTVYAVKSLPIPSYKPKKVPRHNKAQSNQSHIGTTLGDFFKAQGINLSDLISTEDDEG